MEPRNDRMLRSTRRPRRILDFLWLVIPTITLIAVAGYFIGALILRVNPPALAIQSQTMSPAIKQGDLAIIKGVDPRTLKPGQVIAVKLTGPEESKYSLPSEIVRRIVKITRTNGTELFLTRGDGNPANDPFSVTPSAISGKVVESIPMLGYPILFFSSKQGVIFLIATSIILLIYYILGFMEDRRHYAHATAATMQNVLEMVGYVHDAVQENPTIPLNKFTFPGIEFQKSPPRLQLDIQDLQAAPAIHDSIQPSPIEFGKSDVKEDFYNLIQQCTQLRRVADWLDTGDIDSDKIREVLFESVLAIEALITAIGDPDLISQLEKGKLPELPLPPPPVTPAPSTFPDSEDLQEEFEKLLAESTYTESHSSKDPDPAQNEAPKPPVDAVLMDEEHMNFFSDRDSIFNSADFVSAEDTTASHAELESFITSSKRHRRRSLRRRNS
ncbi:MAG: signal peptidase I [Acidimicrobiaceae bacterium]|nr:signal peptidase I [Acidimicrobiaceae bacterium]